MHVAEDGQAARTRWRVIDRAGTRAAFVELQPLTGRTHQLRAHMAYLGHPIVGDAKYGGAEAFLTGGISRKLHLHARRLKIDAPGNKEIDVSAELPGHFAESLATLGFEARAGDNMPLDRPDPAKSPEVQFRRKAPAAKTARKERKGERRNRGSTPPAAKGTRANGPPAKGSPAKSPPRGRK
jgi:23S rRNA pseudouridine955/2504/2580 synthase